MICSTNRSFPIIKRIASACESAEAILFLDRKSRNHVETIAGLSGGSGFSIEDSGLFKPAGWGSTHLKFQGTALGDIFVANPALVVWLTVQLHRLDVLVG